MLFVLGKECSSLRTIFPGLFGAGNGPENMPGKWDAGRKCWVDFWRSLLKVGGAKRPIFPMLPLLIFLLPNTDGWIPKCYLGLQADFRQKAIYLLKIRSKKHHHVLPYQPWLFSFAPSDLIDRKIKFHLVPGLCHPQLKAILYYSNHQQHAVGRPVSFISRYAKYFPQEEGIDFNYVSFCPNAYGGGYLICDLGKCILIWFLVRNYCVPLWKLSLECSFRTPSCTFGAHLNCTSRGSIALNGNFLAVNLPFLWERLLSEFSLTIASDTFEKVTGVPAVQCLFLGKKYISPFQQDSVT